MTESANYMQVGDPWLYSDGWTCAGCGVRIYPYQVHDCPGLDYQQSNTGTWITTTTGEEPAECETCDELADEITLLETEINLLRAHVDDWERYHKLAKRIVEITEED